MHGVGAGPLIGQTIRENFDAAVERWRGRETLVVRHQGIRWTYGVRKREVDAFAAGLVALGLEPGQWNGIWSLNNSESAITQPATAKVGLILVNINSAYRIAELEYALNKVSAKALILAARFKSSDHIGMIRELAPKIEVRRPGGLTSARLPDLKTLIQIGGDDVAGMYGFADVAAMAGDVELERLERRTAALQFDDPINIQFTSGTTGFPEGATLAHFDILNNGFFVGEAMKLTDAHRLCVPVPLYHCFGRVLGNVACLTHRAAIVYPDEAFDPLSVLATVEAEKCAALHGVPTMFMAELDHPRFEEVGLSILRTDIMAGCPCPIKVMRRVIAKLNMSEVTIAYGMTETSPVGFQSTADDPVERRVSTVGRIHPNAEVKIVDVNSRVVESGVADEMLTRGYSVMQGY